MRSVKQCSFGAVPVSIQVSAFDTLIFLLVLHCDINRFLDLWVFSNIFVDVHHQYLANGTLTRVVTAICPKLRGRLTEQREN